MNSLRLLHQLLHLKVLHIAAREHPHKLALATTRLPTKVVEALHRTNQPGRLGCRHAPIRHDLSMHENQTLVIRQIQVMCDSSMRLRKRAVHLERAEIRENHRRGVVVDGVLHGGNKVVRGWVECPLQEVDFRGSLGRRPVWRLHVFVGGLAWEREDELGVVAGSFSDAQVRVERDRGTDGGRAVGKSEAPEGLDFFRGQVADLLDVEIGAERFDGGFAAGDFAGGFLGGRLGLGRGRRVEGWRGACLRC